MNTKNNLKDKINKNLRPDANRQKNRGGDQKGKFNLTWVYMGVLAVLFILLMSNNEEAGTKITYTKFQECVDSGYVADIKVDKTEQELFFELRKDAAVQAGAILPKEARGKMLLLTNYSTLDKFEEFISAKKQEGKFLANVRYENGGSGFWNMFWQIFPFIIIIAFWLVIMRRMGGAGGGGVFSFGKSKAKLFEGGGDDADRITFKDVAGLAGAKQEVQEVVDFLRNPQKYTELGGKIPKGILLVGPPGTGKTLLAKAVAGEANVAFFSLSGSDFVEMFVGVGASRVRDLFNQAKAKAPSIVFIDEIDAIGRARSGKASIQSNDERESTLNQLLTEMDGFGANTGVIVMAATNRADILDKALLRAGRFDRQISVELPDLKERQQIFNVHLKPIKIDESVDVELLARQTPGLSGADIANVCNEAALIAARRKQDWVDKQCFLDAVDRVLGGLEKKTKVMTEAEKRTIAIHESGHATISWFLQHANPLVKVTIVPRGNALGANWYMPEERPVTTKEELLDQICGLLGGRAAEELFTGHICTGASNDLERVTKMVYSMIAIYGMGEKMPNVNYYDFSENSFSKPYSETTAQLIDEEVKAIIQKEYDRAKRVLMQNARGLQQLAQLLIDREVIYPADLEKIFGPRQWRSRSDEIMELNRKAEEDAKASAGNGLDAESTDYNDENEQIIRQKAIDAVIEKQRRLQEQQKEAAQNEPSLFPDMGTAGMAAGAVAGMQTESHDAPSLSNNNESQEQDINVANEKSQQDDYNPILDTWAETSVSGNTDAMINQDIEDADLQPAEVEPTPQPERDLFEQEETETAEPDSEVEEPEVVEPEQEEPDEPMDAEVVEPTDADDDKQEPEPSTEELAEDADIQDEEPEMPQEVELDTEAVEEIADDDRFQNATEVEEEPSEYVSVNTGKRRDIEFTEVIPGDAAEDDEFSITLDTDYIENGEGDEPQDDEPQEKKNAKK